MAGHDVVVDISGMGQLFGSNDPSMPVAASYPAHPITERFRLLTAFPMARSITAMPANGTRTARSGGSCGNCSIFFMCRILSKNQGKRQHKNILHLQ